MSSDWPQQEEFVQALYSLMKEKPPPTQVRIVAIAKLALDHKAYYKHIVHLTEKYVAKCAEKSPAHLLGAAYVIDAICRRSQAKFADKDKFGPRFAVKLSETVEFLNQCPEGDKSMMDRLLRLWTENKVVVPGGLSSSSSSAVTNTHKRERIPSPHTPPGTPPHSNKLPMATSSSGPPPPMLGSGGLPPMLGGMGGGAVGASSAPPGAPKLPPGLGMPMMVGLPMGMAMDPVAVDLDFNYDDDAIPATEEAISDAKRRRLEQERRVNEQASGSAAVSSSSSSLSAQQSTIPGVPPEILSQVQALLNDPRALSAVLKGAGLTYDGLIRLLTPSGSPELIAQLRTLQTIQERAEQRSKDEIVEMNGSKYVVRWSTTVYIGNVPATVTEDEIRKMFSQFGRIQHITHRPEQGQAFVTYASRDDAETAQMEMMNFPVHDSAIKTGWARGPDMREGEFERKTGRGLMPLVGGGAGAGGSGGGGGGQDNYKKSSNNNNNNNNNNRGPRIQPPF